MPNYNTFQMIFQIFFFNNLRKTNFEKQLNLEAKHYIIKLVYLTILNLIPIL